MHAGEAEQTPLDGQLEGRLRQLSSGTPDLKYLLEGEATETAPAQVSDAQLPVPESKDLRAETSWTAKIGEVGGAKRRGGEGGGRGL